MTGGGGLLRRPLSFHYSAVPRNDGDYARFASYFPNKLSLTLDLLLGYFQFVSNGGPWILVFVGGILLRLLCVRVG